ncbi:MAG: hypothetical protein RL141_580 [Candidatus Parcubacteria bacterium]|jgi:methylase of polypeptide subunit release factors
MSLTAAQRDQVLRQLHAHTHLSYETEVIFKALRLEHFSVWANVLRPDQMVAKWLAGYLADHPELFAGKRCMDMGCGSGIQGVVMGLRGAAHVTFIDCSRSAVGNTQENVQKFGLYQKSTVIENDLFSGITKSVHVIIFNHPFFPEKPDKGSEISKAILDDGSLLIRFLQEAKQHLLPGGSIIMPFFHLAGKINDPGIQGPRCGYMTKELWHMTVDTGIQRGDTSIYQLL